MPATRRRRPATVTLDPGTRWRARARPSPIATVPACDGGPPAAKTSLRAKKPRSCAPNTNAEASPFTRPTSNTSGVAASTSRLLLRRPTRPVCNLDTVGSETPAWNTPRSEPPRWTKPPAVLVRPSLTESSATIVATPSPTPSAVSSVRPMRRSRLLTISSGMPLRLAAPASDPRAASGSAARGGDRAKARALLIGETGAQRDAFERLVELCGCRGAHEGARHARVIQHEGDRERRRRGVPLPGQLRELGGCRERAGAHAIVERTGHAPGATPGVLPAQQASLEWRRGHQRSTCAPERAEHFIAAGGLATGDAVGHLRGARRRDSGGCLLYTSDAAD